MKAQILKIAGVKSEKDFYKKFPSEEDFMKVHGEQFRKARLGAQLDGGGFLGESYGVYDPANPTMVTDNSGDASYTQKPANPLMEKLGGIGGIAKTAGSLVQGFQKLGQEKNN